MKRFFLLVLCLLCTILTTADTGDTDLPGTELGRGPSPETRITEPPEAEADIKPLAAPRFTQQEIIYASIILVFGLMVLGLAALLIHKSKTADPLLILRFFVIILIIICSVLLIFVGYNKDQITQIVGLFGTITGYLLGRIDSNKAGQAAT